MNKNQEIDDFSYFEKPKQQLNTNREIWAIVKKSSKYIIQRNTQIQEVTNMLSKNMICLVLQPNNKPTKFHLPQLLYPKQKIW